MGTTIARILEIARKEIGVKEYPMNSNKVKYNTAYYGREVFGSAYPWCCAFIWWLFRQAKAPELFYGGEKTVSCTVLMKYYKKQKQFKTSNPQPGDLVFFNFDKNAADAEHIGIVESVNGGIVIAIEGNTGITNDANGGAVMRRERRTSVILGYAALAYETEQAGWIQDVKTNGWWYRHADGSYTRNGWEKINEMYYYFDKDGWMKTGWIKDNGKWYYCDLDGKMLTGWIKVEGKDYYLKSNGAMAENEMLTIESEIYGKEIFAFASDGHMLTSSGRGALK